jgi:hypothetical protein
MKLWADFLDHVLTHLKGAPIALVEHELRNAAIQFCEAAPVWVEDFTPINVTPSGEDYVVTLPAGVELVRVVNAWFMGGELVRKTPGELTVLYDHWRAQTGTPQFWTQLKFDRLTLVPRQNVTEAEAITGLAQCKPGAEATGVPDEVYAQWYMSIVHGALAQLLAMPEKPWSQPQLAQYHGGLFAAGILAATAKVG